MSLDRPFFGLLQAPPRFLRALACPCVSVVLAAQAGAAPLDRPLDPVVLTGVDLSALVGTVPDRVVAFRHVGAWVQIPVQIDERDTVPFEQVYNGSYGGALEDVETYTDPGTHVGPDSDPLFDDDDELALMARDAGAAAPLTAGEPSGVVLGTGLELQISDSIDGGEGYVYLFETDGSLLPGAGASYVSYDFNLLAGSYPADYNLSSGPNPENTTVTTSRYSVHFLDRWIQDEMAVTAGSASGADILDRHRNIFAPGVCSRSEDTFSDGEGAFFANINGPVRAIRSYMGANSGPLTQRVHHFYESRQDIASHLRVHAIPAMLDMFDHSPLGLGMTYYDSNNSSGLSIDGVPDSHVAGFPAWAMVTGAQGSLILSAIIETDIVGLPLTGYYVDDATPSYTQCTGDAFEYGANGVYINGSIPNTDPRSTPYSYLTATRIVYYEEPNKSVADAQLGALRAETPLDVTVVPYTAAVPGLSGGALLVLAGVLAGVGAKNQPSITLPRRRLARSAST